MTALLSLVDRRWPDHLAALGFEPNGAGVARADGLGLSIDGSWLVLSRPANPQDEVELGRPGLWRTVATSTGRRQLFEVPLVLLRGADPEQDDETEPTSALTALLAWALATAGVERVVGWNEPTQDDAVALVGAPTFTCGRGAILAPAHVCVGPSRLALEVFEVARVPGDLEAARRAWVDALLDDARSTWRMVRLGLVDECVRAEVDLSGAPASILEGLLPAGREALTRVVGWLLPSLTVLLDPSVESRLMDRAPETQPPERRRHA